LNMLEYLDDPAACSVPARHPEANGVLVVLCPAARVCSGPSTKLGTQTPLQLAGRAPIARIPWLRGGNRVQFNKVGAPPWWAYSRLFGSRNINKLVLKIFDKTVWIWRRLDWLMPWPGLSLIVVARKRAAQRFMHLIRYRPLQQSVGGVRRPTDSRRRRSHARRVICGKGVAHLPESARPRGRSHGESYYPEAPPSGAPMSGEFTDRVAVRVSRGGRAGRQLLDLWKGSGIDTSGVSATPPFPPP